MKYDPQKHHRRSIRLPGHDYSRPGGYFVTIVAHGRECLFGEIVNDEMRLNEYGQIADDAWQWLARQYPYIELGIWVVMPNHLHGIIVLHEAGRGGSRGEAAPTGAYRPKPLGGLIGAFKTVSAKKINLLRKTEGGIVWQRNYYEHIIRNDEDYNRIPPSFPHFRSSKWGMQGGANPAAWAEDQENPT